MENGVIREIKQKDNNGNFSNSYKIGSEPIYIKGTLGSRLWTLEHQLMLGGEPDYFETKRVSDNDIIITRNYYKKGELPKDNFFYRLTMYLKETPELIAGMNPVIENEELYVPAESSFEIEFTDNDTTIEIGESCGVFDDDNNSVRLLFEQKYIKEEKILDKIQVSSSGEETKQTVAHSNVFIYIDENGEETLSVESYSD